MEHEKPIARSAGQRPGRWRAAFALGLALSSWLPLAAQAGSLGIASALASATRDAMGSPSAQASPALPKSVGGFAACPQFFPQGRPPVIPQAAALRVRELCFDSFAVAYSGLTKTPVYVVERLTREQVNDAADEERTNVFFADARLPAADRATLDDYSRSGFDRGHMAPAGDMPNAQSMAQSFSLANIVPQPPQNNRKTWKGIESATRKYVRRAAGDVFVFTAPLYKSPQVQTIGPNKVWVPSHLTKLVYDAQAGRAWAHWLENTDEARTSAPISYSELMTRQGIDFLNGARTEP